MKRRLTVGISWTVVMAGIVGICSPSFGVMGEDTHSGHTTDRAHPLVKALEERYQLYLKAGEAGDVDSYKSTRTAAAVSFMEQHLKKAGKLDDFSRMIREQAPDFGNPSDFQFIAADWYDDAARLAYVRDSAFAPVKPNVEFLVIMYQREQGAWRIGPLGLSLLPKYHDDGTATTLAEVLKDVSYQLPVEPTNTPRESGR